MLARTPAVLAVVASLTFAVAPAVSSQEASLASLVPHEGASQTATGVTGGALFGSTEEMVPEEPTLGRKLAIIRVYKTLGNVFPDTAEKAMLAQGSTMMVSLDLRDDQTYKEVSAGQFDSEILSFCKSVNAAAVKYGLGSIYVDFEHEPSIKKREIHGPPAAFVRAWRHVYRLIAGAGLDWQNGGRLHWVWIMDHDSYNTNVKNIGVYGPGTAPLFWPGAAYVDITAVDAYNHPGCHSHTPPGTTVYSPRRLFGSALAFAQSHGNKPVYITEFASIAYPDPTIRPTWINSVTTYVTAHPQIMAADYWDGFHSGATCTFNINNDPASLSAFAKTGQALTGKLIPPGS
jgi:hypothetical protein